jgi:hypothetical protein
MRYLITRWIRGGERIVAVEASNRKMADACFMTQRNLNQPGQVTTLYDTLNGGDKVLSQDYTPTQMEHSRQQWDRLWRFINSHLNSGAAALEALATRLQAAARNAEDGQPEYALSWSDSAFQCSVQLRMARTLAFLAMHPDATLQSLHVRSQDWLHQTTRHPNNSNPLGMLLGAYTGAAWAEAVEHLTFILADDILL